ncbi:YIP1 family protein [Cystobacter fuscus]|uniref:YIP1 family protein n=1 Tax=Cystobacter fuscus TaxID=43 RepID=UPI002B2CC150|nr:YIP1 family protein [Cystobacter fuscus]
MSIPCPYCQHPFAPGAQSCPGCGASLLLEAVPGGTQPVCAVHPTLRGLGTCSRCGTFACARCLRAGPQGETLCARCHQLEPDAPLPWDQREELGLWRAFWKTLGQVLLRPGTFAQARAEGRTSDSLLFALLCSVPACFMTGLTYMIIFVGMPSLMEAFPESSQPTGDGSGPVFMRWMGVVMFVATTLLGPPLSVLMTLMGAGVDHLVLRAGGVTRPFNVTLRAHSLSEAAWTLGIVPFIGTQVAPFWALVSRFFAYRGLHRTTTGTALVGTLLAPLASCCLCGGGYIGLLFLIFSRAAQK